MWTLVAYAVAVLMDRLGTEIGIDVLRHLVLHELPASQGLWIVDSREELWSDLELMEELGLVELDRDRWVVIVREPGKLRAPAEKMRRAAEALSSGGVPLPLEYLVRIERGAERVIGSGKTGFSWGGAWVVKTWF